VSLQDSDDKIRILTLTPNVGFGGSENRICAFAKSIDRTEFDIHVTTVNQPSETSEAKMGSLREEFSKAGIPILSLGAVVRDAKSVWWRPDHWIRKLVELYRVLRTFRNLIREHRIDVVDAHCQDAALMAFLVSFVCRVKLVATLYHPGVTPFAYWSGKFYLARFDAIVTDSVVRKDDLEKWILGNPSVHVIYNGVAPPESDRSRDDIELDLGLAGISRSCVIGQIGRLIPFKGQSTLLRAAQLVLQEHPDVFFLVVGHAETYPEFFGELTQLAEELGIADRVYIGGYGGAVGDVWSVIDIHVHASHFDSLPNAILEGMSYAKPAVVTDVGGVKEIVTHERTGFVVPPKNAQAISECLIKLLEDKKLAAEYSSAAYDRFQQTCTPEIISQQIETLLKQIVPRQRKHRKTLAEKQKLVHDS